MGVHTWVYKKVSSLTPEEKTKYALKHLEDAKKWWGFDTPLEKIKDRLKRIHDNIAHDDNNVSLDDYVKNIMGKYNKKVKDIEERGFDAIVDRRKEYLATFYECNGELYYLIATDTPFRSFAYIENDFTEVEPLIRYLRDNSKKVGYYNKNSTFVKGFSNNLERAIRAFFNKHTDNSLLINFG